MILLWAYNCIKIVIFGGGIGQPFITTAYPSVQRALDINADVVLMAKMV
jgi:uridylate kinase